jgi:hypothetical protein
MERNRYRVPEKQWNKWSEAARRVFNEVYYTLTRNRQVRLLHPKTKPLPAEEWQTPAWNAAWIAADAVR